MVDCSLLSLIYRIPGHLGLRVDRYPGLQFFCWMLADPSPRPPHNAMSKTLRNQVARSLRNNCVQLCIQKCHENRKVEGNSQCQQVMSTV